MVNKVTLGKNGTLVNGKIPSGATHYIGYGWYYKRIRQSIKGRWWFSAKVSISIELLYCDYRKDGWIPNFLSSEETKYKLKGSKLYFH